MFLNWKDEDSAFAVQTLMMNKQQIVISSTDTEILRLGSITIIKNLLKSILPIVICSFFLAVIATISASTISVKRQLKNYAIYSLCGLSKKGCIKVSMIHSLGCTIGAFLFAWFGVIFAGKLDLHQNEIGWLEFMMCVLIFMLFNGIAFIVPAGIFRRFSVKDILREQ